MVGVILRYFDSGIYHKVHETLWEDRASTSTCKVALSSLRGGLGSSVCFSKFGMFWCLGVLFGHVIKVYQTLKASRRGIPFVHGYKNKLNTMLQRLLNSTKVLDTFIWNRCVMMGPSQRIAFARSPIPRPHFDLPGGLLQPSSCLRTAS